MEKLVSQENAFSLLKKNSIPFAEVKTAKNPEHAAEISAQIGFPVAMKIDSKKVVHKSDAGGVKVGIKSKQEAFDSFNQIIESVKKKTKTKPEGILVQKMVSGTEVIIGMKRDPQFGPAIMFGLGGIFVEVLKDVSLRIAPLTKNDCVEMIEEIKGKDILKGARGRKPVKIDELVKIMLKVSEISMKNQDISEMDLNPVIVNENEAKVVDIRIIEEK